MSEEQYQAELERIFVELARIAQEIRKTIRKIVRGVRIFRMIVNIERRSSTPQCQ